MDAEYAPAFAAWPLYYPNDATVDMRDGRVEMLKAFVAFLQSTPALLRNVDWTRQRVVNFNYEDMLDNPNLPADFPSALRTWCEPTLAALGLALCCVRARHLGDAAGEPIKLVARIHGILPLLPLRELRSNAVGNFVSVRGNVVRVSSVRPLVQRMSFTCDKCRAAVPMSFVEGKYEAPPRCADTSCRSRAFTPVYSSAAAVDWQKVRLQELEADLADAGRVPRTVEVELMEDLVDSCVPGDVVTVCGVVKAIETDVAAGKGTAQARQLYLLYIDARSVTTHKNDKVDAAAAGSDSGGVKGGGGGGSAVSKAFSERDLAFLAKVRAHRDPAALVVASMCPAIFGHENVKLGLLLGLFGGTPQEQSSTIVTADGVSAGYAYASGVDIHAPPRAHDSGSRGSHSIYERDGGEMEEVTVVRAGAAVDGPAVDSNARGVVSAQQAKPQSSRMHIRSNPHVLVVGDPGLGKSQMLQALAALAPRGVYVSGNTASTTGLTVVR